MSRSRLIAAAVLAVVTLALALAWTPFPRVAASLAVWARTTGAAGAVAYAGIIVAATVLLFPASILTIAVGFAYGPLRGAMVAIPAGLVGMLCAFLLARTTARSWAARRIARVRWFAAVDRAIAHEGFKVVVLL